MKEHPVGQAGSGYVCLATDAMYFVSVAAILSGEKRKEVFADWDKAHKATHRLATSEELAAYNKKNR